MAQSPEQQFIASFHEAEGLFREGEWLASREKYEALLRQAPDQVAVLNNLGLVCEKLGEFKRAATLYQRCAELDQNQIIFRHNFANALTRTGDWEQALPVLEGLVSEDFQNEDNSEKYALGLFNFRSREQARNFIEKATIKYPDNPVLNRLLGRSLLHLNQHAAGLHYLNKGAGVIRFTNDTVHFPS